MPQFDSRGAIDILLSGTSLRHLAARPQRQAG